MSEHDTSRTAGGATGSPTGAADGGQQPPARLLRFPDDGPGAGVAAGLGAYFGVDPVLFRIAFLVLAFAGGSGVLLYGIAWLVIPAAPAGETPRTAGRQAVGSDRTAQWVGIGLIVAAAFWLTGPFDIGGPLLWAVALVAIGVLLFRDDATRRSGDGASAVPPAWSSAGGAAPRDVQTAGGDARTAGGDPQAAGDAPAAVAEGRSTGHAAGPPAADAPPADARPADGQPADGQPAEGQPADGQPAQAVSGADDRTEVVDAGAADPQDEEEALLEEAARLREGAHGGWSAGGWELPERGWDPPERTPATTVPAAPAPRRSVLGRATIGVALVAVGIIALAENLAPGFSVSPRRYVALGLLIIGAGLLVGAWLGRARGLIPVGLLLLPVLAATALFPYGTPWQGGVGERTWQPTELAELEPEYRLAAGQLSLDLSDVDFGVADEQVISAGVGLGEVEVILPPDVDVTVNARAGAGELDILGRTVNGVGLERTVTDSAANAGAAPGAGSLTLDLDSGLGQITVVRAAR